MSTLRACYYVNQNLVTDSLAELIKTDASYRLYIPEENRHLDKVRVFNSWLSENISLCS